jgi:uncharacterized cofD-like protein
LKKIRKYFLPGLKRWIFFMPIGLIAIAFGIALVFKAHPVTRIAQFTWNTLSYIADHVPPTASGIVSIILGIFLLAYAVFRSSKQVLNIVAPDQNSLLDTLDRMHMANKGVKIVAIGGGTGLSNMLKGLKVYSSNITAVVTVADDGGSSGRLRESLNIVPPGDIRNCIAALAHDDEVITQLFQYRFDEDSPKDLQNHSFGNLFLTALVELGGSRNMADAVKQACKILKTRGKVLPVSNTPMNLEAYLEDGRLIKGESAIPEAGGKIKKLFCTPPIPPILPEVIDAIKEAEIIVYGPGSLYTSIIPNLLVPELIKSISKSSALKIYICNVMTQPGETSGYTAANHVEAIKEHTQEYNADFSKLLDYIVVNNSSPHKKQLEKYAADNQYPVEVDQASLKNLGLKIFPTNLIQRGNLVRHNPSKLAKSIMEIYSSNLGHKSKLIRMMLNK